MPETHELGVMEYICHYGWPLVQSPPVMWITQHQGVGMETINGATVILPDPSGGHAGW